MQQNRFHLFSRLYRWETASRKWVYERQLAVVSILLLPSVAMLAVLVLAPDTSNWMRTIAEGGLWLSIGLLLAYIGYSLLRTMRAVWKAIRGEPHELDTWREP